MAGELGTLRKATIATSADGFSTSRLILSRLHAPATIFEQATHQSPWGSGMCRKFHGRSSLCRKVLQRPGDPADLTAEPELTQYV